MASLHTAIRFLVLRHQHNLDVSSLKVLQSSYLPRHQCYQRRTYSAENQKPGQTDVEEKRKRFQEFEKNYQAMLCLDKLTSDEKRIHFHHQEAVAKGHFTYDDPFLNEKVLTRLRHFLKGKCCGKSCRHVRYPYHNM